MSDRNPNFFIVGAPRCGTSAMHEYLDAHPDVYMSWVKEPHYFCADLNDERDQNRGGRQDGWPIVGLEQYLWLFRNAGDAPVRGESSVLYLYSQAAAQQIAQFDPGAKILVMIREPVSFLRSLHSLLVYQGDETCHSFVGALDLEEDRRRGDRIPSLVRIPSIMWYSRMAAFSEQIRRYLECFPPEQVKVVVFDDFRGNTREVYADVLRFLGVDDRVPLADASPRNLNKRPRWRRLALWSRRLHPLAIKLARDPEFPRHPDYRQKFPANVLPTGLAVFLHRAMVSVNSQRIAREPLDPEEERGVKRRFRDEVGALGELLQRDLAALWGYDQL